MTIQQLSEIRVRYAETDAMAVAHHANYPIWFEVGRSELMRTLGVPYSEIEARGLFFMLSSLEVHYRAAARYDDLLTLSTTVEAVQSRAVTFAYTLKCGETLVATGKTHHITTDKNYKIARIPDDILPHLRGS
ncbi:acyl-CoA thioesterase [Deinococcus psychrotolerans]|uniref:Acyl-CoA thioesterase n=1 Tax=Deinococcus psychrotolerans TaxID=2489213 RepID=A0A3G8YF29_9DEIO|nr:thioesterase family protein [Deinococcus psychrotolerans]AZI43575.1 acyl-CoA thioesterase [Deinococcus psychrotolerans]